MEESDALLDKEPLLAKCYAASVSYLSVLGQNAGKPLLRLISPDLIREETIDERTVMGFNLHASDAIEAHDTAGLERILRYMGRPPLSIDRLKMSPDGKHLVLTLKTPWRNGTEKILMTPFNLLERLVAIIPPPRKNTIRYHGFFGPNAKVRGELVPSVQVNPDESTSMKISRPGFALLMSRVFDIDILSCPRCNSKMQIISFVRDPKAIKDILISLKMSTAPPAVFRPAEYTVCYDEEAEPFMDDVQ